MRDTGISRIIETQRGYIDALANSVKSTELIEAKAGRYGGTYVVRELLYADRRLPYWINLPSPEIHMSTNTKLLVIAGVTIKTDEEGRYCLNDFHKAAGGAAKHQPNLWLRLEATTELIHEVEVAVIPQMCGVSAKAGRYGGTFAVRELVYAYATWISPKFHLEVIRSYDRLTTNGVVVHRNAAEDLLANPLKYFEVVFNEAKKLSEENKRLEEEKAVLQPKADTFDLVVAHKRVSVAAFCRTMQGVNIMKVKESLKKLGYLYRLGSDGNYRVYTKFHRYFEERLNAEREGSWELYPTEVGKSLLVKLYKDGKLQMKNS